MNDLRRKRYWSRILSVAAFVLVIVWCVWEVPRTSQFKAYKHKTEIRARLYSVDAPRGVHWVRTETKKFPPGNQCEALGVYSGVIECDAVIAHYKEQFPKQGFALIEEKADAQKHEKAITFIASDYQAVLTCTSQELPQLYTILMWPTQFHAEEVRP